MLGIFFGQTAAKRKLFLQTILKSLSAKEEFVLSSVLRLHCARFPVPLHELYLVTTPHSPLRKIPTVT